MFMGGAGVIPGECACTLHDGCGDCSRDMYWGSLARAGVPTFSGTGLWGPGCGGSGCWCPASVCRVPAKLCSLGLGAMAEVGTIVDKVKEVLSQHVGFQQS